MFRRAVLSVAASSTLFGGFAAAAQRRALLAATPAVATSIRFNSSSASADASKESELEREARARQELLNKLGGNSGGAGAGQQQQAGGSGAQAFMQQFNSPNHRAGRFFATCVITVAMYQMLKRIGIFGDYSHLSLPYFAASGADSAKWILFMFNVDDTRRRQLQAQWQVQKGSYPPQFSFFDFVDQQEQFWRSSPNNGAESVAAMVGNTVLVQGAPRAIANVKGTLGGSSPLGMFGGNLLSAEERAKRIDNMMSGQAALNAGFSGLLMSGGGGGGAPALPASFLAAPPAAQMQAQQQQQQWAAWPPQQQQQQQWGYMPPAAQQPQPGQLYAGYPGMYSTGNAPAAAAADPNVHGSTPFAK